MVKICGSKTLLTFSSVISLGNKLRNVPRFFSVSCRHLPRQNFFAVRCSQNLQEQRFLHASFFWLSSIASVLSWRNSFCWNSSHLHRFRVFRWALTHSAPWPAETLVRRNAGFFPPLFRVVFNRTWKLYSGSWRPCDERKNLCILQAFHPKFSVHDPEPEYTRQRFDSLVDIIFRLQSTTEFEFEDWQPAWLVEQVPGPCCRTYPCDRTGTPPADARTRWRRHRNPGW